MAAVSVAIDTRDLLGESPVWDADAGCLYWVDIRSRLVHRWNASNGVRRQWEVPEPVGSLALRSNGGLLVALRSGLAHLDTSDGRLTWLARLHLDRPEMRLNDGKCDPTGCFWVGSMNDGSRVPDGSLYRFDPDHVLQHVLPGITVPNSLCWAPDGRTMYFSDSHARVIWAFDFKDGEPGGRRVFATIEPPAVPDGATVDRDGFVWCALYHGGAIARFAPDGRLVHTVTLPVEQPTSCAFGGPRLDTLYVTSARQNLQPAALSGQPLAGAVLAIEPGVRGLVEPRFAG
jgi:sugar lactone lactonase YvrE